MMHQNEAHSIQMMLRRNAEDRKFRLGICEKNYDVDCIPGIARR
jgi:hypothetical protein